MMLQNTLSDFVPYDILSLLLIKTCVGYDELCLSPVASPLGASPSLRLLPRILQAYRP